MKRMRFGSDGRLLDVDGRMVGKFRKRQDPEETELRPEVRQLLNSENLQFLKEERPKVDAIFENEYWSLYENNRPLEPLKFSNGKTQEDVVKEIVQLIRSGKKIIFLHGVCGTGKSAIALNIARALGRTSIVVPVKTLQKQYEADYMGRKFVTKKNGAKMKIAMITGRENHASLIKEGASCADPYLPDTIKIIDKNAPLVKQYYEDNPFISNNEMPLLHEMKRISIAPSNPHWSPILPADVELNQLKDAKKHKYTGMYGKKYVFYHRKPGCSYYDQYLSYISSDVIIFNSAKYLAETSIGRKPQTEVDIIDEADEFLDSFSANTELNLTRLYNSLQQITTDSARAETAIKRILELIDAEETKARAIGIDEEKIHKAKETKLSEILTLLHRNSELEAEIEIDETNYSNTALEAARDFAESLEDTYLTYRKEDDNLFVRLVTLNLAKKFNELVDGNKAMVLMSGTLHSDEVLRHIFGIEDYAWVEAETLNQGTIEIMRTGKEFDCRYSTFQSGARTRGDYLEALHQAIQKSIKPTLVHVNAYTDLPNESEVMNHAVHSLIQKEVLYSLQDGDKNGEHIQNFKQKKISILFTTKCSRGVDFPGDMCRSVVFTKYPNPNVKDVFWKILQQTHPDWYWEFYRDKAHREFLQRIYRAVRSHDDHVYVLSPDSRVLDAVRELQLKM